MARLRSGDTVAERFIVRGRLAAGGMAEVYVADALLPRGLSRRVAIKRVHAHLVDDPEFKSMFLDEVRISSQLSHPGVIPVLDAIESAGELLLVLDYVPGWDLAAILRDDDAPLPIEAVAHLGRSLAETLHAVHRARDGRGEPMEIVHRDLSPSNVLVAEDGTVRLLDFGVAKAASRTTRSATRSLKGKLAYLSPEQVRGEAIDARTDLYALGLLLFEALTGRRAIAGKDDVSILEVARAPHHRPASTHRSEIPRELDEIVSRLLSADIEKRPTDGEVVARALAVFDDGTGREKLKEAVRARMNAPARPVTTDASAIDAALAEAIALTGPRTLHTPTKPDTPTAKALPDESSRKVEPAHRSPRTPRSPRLPWLWFAVASLVLVGVGIVIATRTDHAPDSFGTADTTEDVSRGFVRLSSVPSGARVRVGDTALDEPTPTVSPVRAGDVTIRFELDDYEVVEREVSVEADETTNVSVALSRLPARLDVRSEPSGAEVALDGRVVGTTPWSSARLERRVHAIELELPGHAPETVEVDLDANREATVSRNLVARREYGTLDVQSTPWAIVYLDGRRVAESTPALGLRVPTGEHRIRLHNPRHGLSATRNVTIEEGRRARVVVNLE